MRLDEPRCDDILGSQKPGKVFAARGSFWTESWEREREERKGLDSVAPSHQLVFAMSYALSSPMHIACIILVNVNHPALVVSNSQLD
jgi:hypothetical protein